MQPHVAPLAIHVTSRPHAGDEEEPITRRPLLSIAKLTAEGSPAEVQIVLGWRLDTRRLILALPDDKFKAWTEDIVNYGTKGYCRFEELNELVGRLNHAAYIMVVTRHFLSRLRQSLTPRKHNHAIVRLTGEVLAD